MHPHRSSSWLWLVVVLTFAFCAHASAAPEGRRMAVVISGPPKLALQVHEQLTLPLSAEAQIVQPSDYRRAAASIGITRHPRSNRAAPWVGRALGVDLVLLIDGVKEWGQSGAQVFIGVRLL